MCIYVFPLIENNGIYHKKLKLSKKCFKENQKFILKRYKLLFNTKEIVEKI